MAVRSVNDMKRYRYAPEGWQPGFTRVIHGTGERGVFVSNSLPLPGVTPKSWLGVLVLFDGGEEPEDVDPADLEVEQC
jgi:hypothetical protein